MDWFTTSIELAGLQAPTDRIIDGISLAPALFKNKPVDRPIFYYRGNEMMAVRVGMYKAHYWTWTNSIEEFQQKVHADSVVLHSAPACIVLVHVQLNA